MPIRRLRRALTACAAATAAACAGPLSAPDPGPATQGTAGGQPNSGAGPAAAASFTVAASGDVLIHRELAAQAEADARATGARAYDFRPLLAGIKPVVSGADLAICHLETPLAPPGGPFAYYPEFSVPPQVAGAIKATGYDTCSTASNHTLDRGAAGVRRTLDDLDAAGVRHTGSARSAAEAATPDILDVRGVDGRGAAFSVKVAQLSYAYGFNGLAPPRGQPWLANRIDPAAILAAARRARAAGAQVVVVSLHWGEEYQHAPTAEQRALARRLLADSAVDLIIGCHAHVTQPFEQVNGKWVVYGMGNLVARPLVTSTQEGVIALLRFTRSAAGRWRVTRAEYVPTYVELGPPIRVVSLPAALAGAGLPAAVRQRYAAAQADTDRVVASLGAGRAGLVRARP